MFLTSSIAIGMIGFSDRFKANNKLLVLIVATFVIVLISFGLHATNNFIVMLKKASNEKSMSSLDAELLCTIKQWPLFAYSGFLTLILLAFIINILEHI